MDVYTPKVMIVEGIQENIDRMDILCPLGQRDESIAGVKIFTLPSQLHSLHSTRVAILKIEGTTTDTILRAIAARCAGTRYGSRAYVFSASNHLINRLMNDVDVVASYCSSDSAMQRAILDTLNEEGKVWVGSLEKTPAGLTILTLICRISHLIRDGELMVNGRQVIIKTAEPILKEHELDGILSEAVKQIAICHTQHSSVRGSNTMAGTHSPVQSILPRSQREVNSINSGERESGETSALPKSDHYGKNINCIIHGSAKGAKGYDLTMATRQKIHEVLERIVSTGTAINGDFCDQVGMKVGNPSSEAERLKIILKILKTKLRKVKRRERRKEEAAGDDCSEYSASETERGQAARQPGPSEGASRVLSGEQVDAYLHRINNYRLESTPVEIMPCGQGDILLQYLTPASRGCNSQLQRVSQEIQRLLRQRFVKRVKELRPARWPMNIPANYRINRMPTPVHNPKRELFLQRDVSSPPTESTNSIEYAKGGSRIF